jgi:hypothetical protein
MSYLITMESQYRHCADSITFNEAALLNEFPGVVPERDKTSAPPWTHTA